MFNFAKIRQEYISHQFTLFIQDKYKKFSPKEKLLKKNKINNNNLKKIFKTSLSLFGNKEKKIG